MKKTTLIIVRHGNTFNKGDIILRVGAQTDLPLTEEGILQGERVGKMIASQYACPEIVICSPLKRALESAEAIVKAYPQPPRVVKADFLTELDYGVDDGKPEIEVEKRLGQLSLGLKKATDNELILEGKRVLKLWDTDSLPPKGWSVDVEHKRSDWKLFGSEIVRRFAEKTVVAVTSNGIAKFATAMLADEAKMPTESLKLATGAFGVFEYDFPSGEWHCTAWNVRPPKEELTIN